MIQVLNFQLPQHSFSYFPPTPAHHHLTQNVSRTRQLNTTPYLISVQNASVNKFPICVSLPLSNLRQLNNTQITSVIIVQTAEGKPYPIYVSYRSSKLRQLIKIQNTLLNKYPNYICLAYNNNTFITLEIFQTLIILSSRILLKCVSLVIKIASVFKHTAA